MFAPNWSKSSNQDTDYMPQNRKIPVLLFRLLRTWISVFLGFCEYEMMLKCTNKRIRGKNYWNMNLNAFLSLKLPSSPSFSWQHLKDKSNQKQTRNKGKHENTVTWVHVYVVAASVSICGSYRETNRTDLGHWAISSKAAENQNQGSHWSTEKHSHMWQVVCP